MQEPVFQITGTADGKIVVESALPLGEVDDIVIGMAFAVATRRGMEFSENDTDAVKLAFAQSHVQLERANRLTAIAARRNRWITGLGLFSVGVAFWNLGRLLGWLP